MRDKSKRDFSVKDNGYWHYYWVMKNPDFQKITAAYKRYMHTKYPDLFDFDHTYFPTYGVDEDDRQKFLVIADEYDMHPWYLHLYLDGFLEESPIHSINPMARIQNGRIVVEMGPKVTEKQFRDMWPMVEMLQTDLEINPAAQATSKANHELFYWILRGRKNTTPDKLDNFWEDTFYKVGSDELPGYKQKPNDKMYATAAELRREYNKHAFVKIA